MAWFVCVSFMLNRDKKPQIVIQDLSVIYNKGQSNEVRSLVNANLKLYPQEYVIIFGPSGCGKSTLLYTIAGLQKPTKGHIEIDNSPIYELEKKEMVEFHRRKIGMVFQAFYLIPSLNVTDNICLPKTASSATTKERKETSQALLKRFGILNQGKKMPGELSGGQKQRVSIARALSNNPDIILADEPVGNLDSVSSHNVMKLLDELNKKDKKTIILVTHDPAHLRYGDRVIYLKDGKIIKEEIVEKKISPKDAQIEEINVSEKISPDLKMLMRAFKDLSLSQVGVLMAPFKAQQLFSHISLSKTHEQINRASKNIEELLFDRFSIDEFVKLLDAPIEEGGAGWDQRTAQRFAERAYTIVRQAKKIDLMKPDASAFSVLRCLVKTFHLKLSEEQLIRLKTLFILRLKNKISFEEVQKGMDYSVAEGGVGIDKRTSMKLAREVEILLLLNYG